MFTIKMTIARPVDEVFANLAQVENAPEWYSAVTSVHRVDNGPLGIGTRFRLRRRLGSSDVVNDVDVTAIEPDRTLELSSVSGPTPFVYRYELSPSARGTQLRLHGTISAEGLAGPVALFRPLAEKLFQRGMTDNLMALKRLIETRDRPARHIYQGVKDRQLARTQAPESDHCCQVARSGHLKPKGEFPSGARS